MAATLAKALAAIQNARKSTGPKTEEGKRKSRMNALKHGLTAKTVLMPEEDPAEFEQHMVGWFDALRPRDKLEVSLVERGAYTYWQLDRATRAESARLWSNADAYADEKANQVSKDVAALVQRLMQPPNGGSVALPCESRIEGDPDEGMKKSGANGSGDHPREIVRELTRTLLGCERLLEFWNDLATSLDEDGWRLPERFRAFRLLGIHPSDIYMNTELASLIQACQAIDPAAGSLVGEIWYDGVPKDKLPQLEAIYQRKLRYLPAIDQEGGRQFLRGIISRKAEELTLKAEQLIDREKSEEQLAPLKMAFDDSREGQLMRRYQHSCNLFFLRCLDELEKHRKQTFEWSKKGVGTRYYRPTPAWFEELSKGVPADYLARMEESDQQRAAEIEEYAREEEGAGAIEGSDALAASESDNANVAECTPETVAEPSMEHPHKSNLAETGPRVETQRTLVVGDGACTGPGLATNGVTTSNRDRKRRRREERKRMRELASQAVSC